MTTRSLYLAACMLLCLAGCAWSQSLKADQVSAIDQIANKIINDTGVPSALVGVVRNGKIIFTKGYGNGRLEPSNPMENWNNIW